MLTEKTADRAGVRLSFRLTRPPGDVRAAVELFIPQGRQHAQGTYREFRQGLLTFEASKVTGTIELPAFLLGTGAEPCPCDGGRFELLCRDDGADGTPLTEDDRFRILRRGVFSDQSGMYCLPPAALTCSPHTLGVTPLWQCLGQDQASPRGGPLQDDPLQDDPAVVVDPGVGCQLEDPDPDPYEDEGGCGGEEPDEESWEESGCEGDGSVEDEYEYGSGCEDSSADSESMDCEGDQSGDEYEGCEGDSGGSACAGDAEAAVYAGRQRPSRRLPSQRLRQQLARHLGALSPFIIFGVFVTFSSRHRRRATRPRRER